MRLSLPLLVMAPSLGLVAWLSGPPQGGRFAAVESIPDARVVKLVARSHLSLVTDLAWVRTTALAGGLLRGAQDGKVLLAWARFVTDLDERFKPAYSVGGLLGPVKVGETFANVDEAVALLERGTRALPEDYTLFIYLAYTQLELRRDPVAAAHALTRAADLPGAPAYLASLASRLLAEGGQLEAARDFARRMAESDDPLTRDTFQARLREIDREIEWRAAEAAVGRWLEDHPRPPRDFEELVRAGLLPAAPVDPVGGRFELAPDGGVSVTSGEHLRAYKSGFNP